MQLSLQKSLAIFRKALKNEKEPCHCLERIQPCSQAFTGKVKNTQVKSYLSRRVEEKVACGSIQCISNPLTQE